MADGRSIIEGDFDMSASVKAYFALKMIGDSPDAPHMRRAREAILARGGAVHCNVFTRVLLSLYGVLHWRSVPEMPVEIMLLPRWFPFHLSKVSYWARTVLVPLLVLQALRPRAKNPLGINIDELFIEPPHSIGPAAKAPHQTLDLVCAFSRHRCRLAASRKVFPQESAAAGDRPGRRFRHRTAQRRGRPRRDFSRRWPMPTMMFDVLGEKEKAADRARLNREAAGRRRRRSLLPALRFAGVGHGLACHALLEIGDEEALATAVRGLDWLLPRQVLDVAGDWSTRRPHVRPGGWAFQYANPHYPDLDDTAVVVMAMDRARRIGAGSRYDAAIERGVEWVKGMQSRNGGWAAFDVDNIYDYLNNIPFADHGALIDPPTEDVTARCVSMLAQLGETRDDSDALSRGVDYLLDDTTPDGSWYGRWGLNYIYGTWSYTVRAQCLRR